MTSPIQAPSVKPAELSASSSGVRSILPDLLQRLSRRTPEWFQENREYTKCMIASLVQDLPSSSTAEATSFFNRLKSVQQGLFSQRSLNDYLAEAIRAGNYALMNHFLALGANLSSSHNRYGKSPLYLSCQWNRGVIADALIKKGADPSIGYPASSETCLHVAAAWGMRTIVRELLTRGADCNARNTRGWTPLHKAVCSNSNITVQILLDAGAEVDSVTGRGETPLNLAARYFAYNEAASLIHRGANIEKIVGSNDPLRLKNFSDLIWEAVKQGDALVIERMGAVYSKSHNRLIKGTSNQALALFIGREDLHALLPNYPIHEHYLNRKVLANSLGIPGHSVLFGHSISLDGAEDSLYFLKKIADHLENRFPKEAIVQPLRRASRYRSSHQLVEEFEREKILVYACGTKDHSMGLVFFKLGDSTYMTVCNRQKQKNYGSLEVYCIDSSNLTPAVFDEISIVYQEEKSSRIARKFYYEELPSMLSASEDGEAIQDALCLDFKQILLSHQKMGNCIFASPIAILRCVTAIEQLKQANSLDAMSSSLATEIVEASKQMTTHIKQGIYKECVDKEMELPVDQRDYSLLREAHRKMRRVLEKRGVAADPILGPEPKKPRKRKAQSDTKGSFTKRRKKRELV